MLQNPGPSRVFRISGQLLWSSVEPMQLGAWRRVALVFRVAHPNSNRFSSRAGSPKHCGLHGHGLVLTLARGGGRIRTI